MKDPKKAEKLEPGTACANRKPLTGEEIDRLLDQLDEQLMAEEIVTQRDIAEARRLPWWMFGFSTLVP
jgi:hypothetical protein